LLKLSGCWNWDLFSWCAFSVVPKGVWPGKAYTCKFILRSFQRCQMAKDMIPTQRCCTLPCLTWTFSPTRNRENGVSGEGASAQKELSFAWAIRFDSGGYPAELIPRIRQLPKQPTLRKGGTIYHQPKWCLESHPRPSDPGAWPEFGSATGHQPALPVFGSY